MIRIMNLAMPLSHDLEDIKPKIIKKLKITQSELIDYEIIRRSIDARKGQIMFHYIIDVKVRKESALKRVVDGKKIVFIQKQEYVFPDATGECRAKRPVIVGAGPAGLFCAYMLAKAGYQPLVLERGKKVEERMEDVQRFWKDGRLNPDSNVQFGEGGAGTFSDGKLNTSVKDIRNRKVLEIFYEFGAKKEILYDAKPHVGTDQLVTFLQNMRREILANGGEIRYQNCVTQIQCKDGKLCGIEVNHSEKMECDVLVLAIGHSARDTFRMLHKCSAKMEAKPFAVGYRVEHPQDMINEIQYHGVSHPNLEASPYKVHTRLEDGRGVYSFCMCPGGYVVNASSEQERLCVNGMSYSGRNGHNANSAIIVSVTPDDFKPYGDGPLAGVAFQEEMESRAYKVGNGKIPQQLYRDFKEDTLTKSYGDFESETKGAHAFADVRHIFPPFVSEHFIEGMEYFGRKIKGFDRPDAIISGIESRTSSPVRIVRDEQFESNIKGVYPCGEGAGYAGGITSAAMDGIKVAEAIVQKYIVK
ncbi:MAG: NAD(P)/FAD-dependent oxidoreductase [Eubacterium sp.]|nr:NAD(P)/FAD-dependent oxidoreductase [Eubacterium sp.]